MMENELTYWVALTHTPKIWTKRKNEIIVHCFNHGKTIADFFESENFLGMELKHEEQEVLSQTKKELANYAFLVEELLNQGYSIIPITSNEYSPTLKSNLKYNSPLVLYTKGNKQILQEQSIAIVGSRNANENALFFTDNVAKLASAEYKVVVSGFAKGVDKQALDSALNYKGQSIIVLPQGIATFGSGIKKYYKQIIEGDVLVLSTFHPKSPWSVDLAMARNVTIYGLASEIYVAQSDDKGGTWSGVCDGLKKGRSIYVRMPQDDERCANKILINMGAIAVNNDGKVLYNRIIESEMSPSIVAEVPVSYVSVDERIRTLLKKGEYSSRQIIEILQLKEFNSQQLTRRLLKMEDIQINKIGKVNLYSLNSNNTSMMSEQLSLDIII